MNNELKRQLEYFKEEIMAAYEQDLLWEYFQEIDIYNHDFSINLGAKGLSYKSICVMLAFGGPNIYLDTDEGALIGAWGGEREKVYLDNDVIENIDDYFEDCFECVR